MFQTIQNKTADKIMKKISETDFAPEIIQKDGIHVVHFYNPYSDNSDADDNMLKDVYKLYGSISFFHINLLHAESLCERYGISSPSVLIFKDGVLQDLLQGRISRDGIENRLQSLSGRLRVAV